MSRYWIAAGILSLGLALPPVAQAANVLPSTNTVSPVTFTFGSGANIWTVAISNCNETNSSGGGGTQVTGNCSNEQVNGVITNNGSLVLTYSSLAGSSLLNTTVGTGLNFDLTLLETVTAPSGRLINSVVLGMTGSSTQSSGLELTDVKVSETDNGAGQTFNINTNLGNGASPYSVVQALSTPANVMTITKDMSVSKTFGTSGDQVALKTVVQTFNVPEPASLALLAVGLGGLIGARRRRVKTAS